MILLDRNFLHSPTAAVFGVVGLEKVSPGLMLAEHVISRIHLFPIKSAHRHCLNHGCDNGLDQVDLSLSTASELKVTFPPVQATEIKELPDELFAGKGM